MTRSRTTDRGRGQQGKRHNAYMTDHGLRIGILGCSDIARRRFLPGLARAANARLVACASRDLGKARQFLPGADYAPLGYEDLLRHDGIGLVYISLPNHLHEEWTLKALHRGKHVLCEKPLGLTFDSVSRMIAAAEEKGLLVYENIMYLHHPQHRLVREMVTRGDIGRLRAFRSAFAFTLRQPGFRLSPSPGGGSFHDQARYPLSAALFHLSGELRDFAGYATMRDGVNLSLTASGVSSAGERIQCSIGFDQQYECWYELVGEQGMIRLERAYTTPADHANAIQVVSGGTVRQVAVPPADHFQLVIEHVAGLIRRRQGFGEAHRDALRLASAADLLWSRCEPNS